MTSHQLRNLQQAHQQYLAVMRAEGASLLSYQTPCCGGTVQTPAAPEGNTWDSAATCIHCGSVYWRAVTDTTVTTK